MFESENYKFRAKTLKADEAVSGVIQRGGLKSLQPKFVICSSKRVFQRFPNMNNQSSLFVGVEPVQATKPAAIKPAVKPREKPKEHSIMAHERPVANTTADKEANLDKMYRALTDGLKKYFSQNHFKRGVVGVSGGVDSALTLKIAVDALGAENVTALIMPELGLTNDENTSCQNALPISWRSLFLPSDKQFDD